MSGTVVREGEEGPESPANEPGELTMSARGRVKPGQSGNLKGRPRKLVKGQSALDCALNEVVTIKDSKGTRKILTAQAIAKRLVQKALSGDIAAVKLLKAESPNILNAVLATKPGKQDHSEFMRYIYETMSIDALREFRSAVASWQQMQRSEQVDRQI